MTDRIVLTARKRSTDPAQEHLREHKDRWNADVKAFIARVKKFTTALVGLKKAISGSPVPRLGLGKGNIKYPLSPVVTKVLDGLASEYQQLAQDYQKITLDGHTIVQEQEAYSRTRRKGKSEGGVVPKPEAAPPVQEPTAPPAEPMPLTAAGDLDLIVTAGEYPLTVEFGATRTWQQAVASLDGLLGEKGSTDASRVQEGILRQHYSFPTSENRDEAIHKVRTETTGFQVVATDLTKEAATPLGRMWTYLKTPFMFGDEDRFARKDMLKSSAELYKLLGQIGKTVLSREPNAIPEFVYNVEQLATRFKSEIQQPLFALREAKAAEQKALVPKEEKPSEKPAEKPAEKPKTESLKTEKPTTPITDADRFPLFVEFSVKKYKDIIVALDKIVGVPGKKIDTSRKESGVLRREYGFSTRDERQQAMLSLHNAKLPDEWGVKVSVQRAREAEPVEEVLVEETKKEPVVEAPTKPVVEAPPEIVEPETAPPVPPDVNRNEQVDTADRFSMIQTWADEIEQLDVRGGSASMIGELSREGIEFDIHDYVVRLIQFELSFRELLREARGVMFEGGQISEDLYNSIYQQYESIKSLFDALIKAVSQAKQIQSAKKAGAITLELHKVAQARVSRWLQRQWISLMKPQDYRTRITADRQITSLGASLDRFMDELQKRNVPVDVLMAQFASSAESLSGLLDTAINLADIHNSRAYIVQLRAKSRRQASPVAIIAERHVTKMKRLKDELETLQRISEKGEDAAEPEKKREAA